MNYLEALKEIEKEYNCRRITPTYTHISVGVLFDEFNYMFVSVADREGKVMLTDNGEYSEIVDFNRYEKEIKELVEKHHLTLDGHRIDKEYISNDDIKTYIAFLYELREFAE